MIQMKAINEGRIGGSFRDPSGFTFVKGGTIYRQINKVGQSNFDCLISSGLYDSLVEKGWLVPHKDVDIGFPEIQTAYKVIQPKEILFISYPYEWCFSQLLDAAMLTLEIQKEAIRYGMSLKDSSAYNIQFDPVSGKPILLDTLSFEILKKNQPWIAYRQFCQHFLVPLALMSYSDVRLSQLLRVYIDGVPLDLGSRLLPIRSFFRLGLVTHIHLHAKTQLRYSDKQMDLEKVPRRITKNQLLGIIDSLSRTVSKLKWIPTGTEWGDYYKYTNYTESAFQRKVEIVNDLVELVNPESVWDLGANTGVLSRLVSRKGVVTIAFDIDPAAVEQNYLLAKQHNDTNLLPLLLDLTNPSPSLGWNNQERYSIQERGQADMVLALALIHHLAIANNIPLPDLGYFFSQLSPWLIIEFVPIDDPQVERLLSSRENIFPNYTFEGFEEAFIKFFVIQKAVNIQESNRRIYLMKRI